MKVQNLSTHSDYQQKDNSNPIIHHIGKNIKAFSVKPGFDLVRFKNRKTKPHVLTCNKFMYRESNQVETEKINTKR